jgi:Na+-translocating ferredoxin:NAD+ oxidoreductase subunit B
VHGCLEVILTAIVLLGVMGLLLGLGLAFSDRWLAVQVDPRVIAVRAALPGTNCGACGFPGCDGAAAAVVEGAAPVTVCVAGGQSAADAVAAVMGVAARVVEKKVALVFCQGGEGRGVVKYRYAGVEDCRAAVLVAGGPKACSYACVGLGNCTRVCPYGAIVMGPDGIPVVEPAKCTGCGLCVAECPKKVIGLVPDASRYHIRCSSHDKGPAVKKVCSVGCIACTLCVKHCPSQAIAIQNFLAVMDYQLCTHAGVCRQKCPTGTIVCEVRPGEAAPAMAAAPLSAVHAPPN